jgi:hypothetical protein
VHLRLIAARDKTSFIGGGGPRFWFSIAPEATQTNYAQVIVQVRDKEATPKLIGPLQDELNKQVPGAWITVRQLQTNPVETPVEALLQVRQIPTREPKARISDPFGQSRPKLWISFANRLKLPC